MLKILDRLLTTLLIYFILCFIGVGCTFDKTVTSHSTSLESWVGNYVFSEFSPPDQNMFYSISIYEEDGEYYAEISIIGFQTNARLEARVIGNEQSVELLFHKYLPENMYELYHVGDLLLSFKIENSQLLTYWGEIQPMLFNSKSGEVYFEKIE